MAATSTSFKYAFNYDVFLSFRGEDTRHGFTGNLYNTLYNRGIHTFFDKEELRGGEVIRPTLVKAIQDSRIAIPVISINYASSSFCLDELATIIKRKNHMLILPIFYKVDPSDVRHQRGPYKQALDKHEERFRNNKDRVLNWREALHQVAELAGHHFKDGDEYEYEFIERIVQFVSSKIQRTLLHVTDYPVGLDSQMLKVKALLGVQPNEAANMVGIHGPSGMGKTTLALAIYNLIADHFDGLCFLENVKEKSKIHGLEYLQSIILSEILGEKKIKLASVQQGIALMQRRLQGKKVLLVLDDVEDPKQLQALAREPSWFGGGSIVIITTQNRQLLTYHKVERLYEIKELNKKDALKLLCWNAFKSEKVDKRYVDFLNRLVAYTSSYPLALQVIGSNLYRKGIEVWRSTIAQCERNANSGILDKLKVVYNALGDEEKSIFLDIACCLKGYGLAEVKRILHAHYDYDVECQIENLVDKSLLKKITRYNYVKVTLHDLLESMAKNIVQQESLEDPGKRSRLWFHKDIVEVLRHNKGSNEIKMIFLQFPFHGEEVGKRGEIHWNPDGLRKMENLRTLIIKNGCFVGGPKYLPNELRVLEWNGYPSNSLPSDFFPKKLSILNLPNSRFASDNLIGVMSRKGFESLTTLRFRSCSYLTHIPDVSCLVNLETIDFSFSENLCVIHESVGLLKNLKLLSVRQCYKLRSLPPFRLPSLERLDIAFCSSLESFPEILGQMGKLTEVGISRTCRKELPCSFRNLTGLQDLYIHSGCPSFSPTIIMLPKLTDVIAVGVSGWVLPKEDLGEEKLSPSNVQTFRLGNCKLTDESFLLLATWFPNVKQLKLWWEDFTIIPECIQELRSLETLEFFGCKYLQDIEGIPPKLKHFTAFACPSISPSCKSKLLNQELHKAGNTKFELPGKVIPEWFEHRSSGTSISFWFRNKLPQLVLCFFFRYPGVKDVHPAYCSLSLFLDINGTHTKYSLWNSASKGYTHILGLKKVTQKHNLSEALLENEWNHARVLFLESMYKKAVPGLIIQYGFHVVENESSMQDIRFSDPFTERDQIVATDSLESQNHRLVDTQVLMKHKLNEALIEEEEDEDEDDDDDDDDDVEEEGSNMQDIPFIHHHRLYIVKLTSENVYIV